jgi:hypothetical protein
MAAESLFGKKLVGKVDSVQFSSNRLLVSTSELEGTNWEGNLILLDGSTGTVLCNLRANAGHADAIWCGGQGRDTADSIAVATDSGAIQVCMFINILLKYFIKSFHEE